MKVLLYIIIILIIVILIVIFESLREHKIFNVKTYRITNDKIPDVFKNTKIVMLSDLHNACYGTNNKLLYKKIEDLKPDLIIIAGDMPVSNSKNYENNIKTAEFISVLSDIADIYYGVGNHERRMRDRDYLKRDWDNYYNIIYKRNGIHKIYYMDNKKISVLKDGGKINIYGLDLDLSYYQHFSKKELSEKHIDNILGKADKSDFNIMIAHNPEYFKCYAAWGADLVLSGHVHGGMIRIPIFGGVVSPKPRLFPHYDYGKYQEAGSTMLLSNGLGSHSVKIRFNNVPEIVLIDL